MSAFNWLGGSLSSPGSWGPQPDPKHPVEPGATDSVTIVGAGTVSGSVAPGSASLSGTFTLNGGILATGLGAVTMNAGVLTIAAGAQIGGLGLNLVGGTIVQNGGAATSSKYAMSIDKGGLYKLVNGTLTANGLAPVGAELIGQTAKSYFVQTGGTNTTTNLQIFAGSYDLSGGSLTVGSSNEYIGDKVGKTGVFTQKSGTHTVNGFLNVSYDGTGKYVMTGGKLTSQADYIGQNGDGSFTQTGGTHTDSGRIVLGVNLTHGVNGTGTYTLGKTGVLVSQTIFIGSDPHCVGTFNFNIAAGDAAKLTVTPIVGYPGLIVGGEGTGTFNQGARSVSTTVAVGFRTTGSGTYNLKAGTLTSTNERVGASGRGVFNHNNGTNIVTGAGLRVGAGSGSNGQYFLNKGTLSASSETIGDSGTGTLTEIAGANTVTKGDLTVGNASGGEGTYTLHAGKLAVAIGAVTLGAQADSQGTFDFNTAAGDAAVLTIASEQMTVGDGGTGTFTEGGGALQTSLDIGAQTGSDGTFQLNAGTLTTESDDQIVGDAGSGTFTQTGGVNTIDGGGLFVGDSGGDGTYQLGGTGQLAITGGAFKIAVGGGSSGEVDFNAAAGDKAKLAIDSALIAVGVHGAGKFVMGGGALKAKFVIGGQVGSNGTLEIDGGTIAAKGQVVGNDGGGEVDQNAGTNKVANGGDLILGAFAAGGGTYDLKGGKLSTGSELVGYAGAGNVAETGGSNTLAAKNSVLDIGVQKHSVGDYVLSKGTLTAVTEIVGDAGKGAFEEKGGANTLSGNLTIGAAAGGSGAYALSAGKLVFKAKTAKLTLGAHAGASGALTLAHATVAIVTVVDGGGGSGQATIGKGGILKIAKRLSITGKSTLDSTLGAATIGSGLTAKAGVIGVGTGGSLIGAGTVKGTVRETSHGSLEAHGGVLALTGAVNGGGVLSIDAGATLFLGAGDANQVSFLAATGDLKLGAAGKMKGAIANLKVGDVIDLVGEKATKATIASGVLTVTLAGAIKQTFKVSGALTGNKFKIASDGAGGSKLTLVHATAQLSASLGLADILRDALSDCSALASGGAAPASGDLPGGAMLAIGGATHGP